MKIAIVGTGYVGLVSGTCFAEIGVNVTCVDTDSEKIESLQKGIIPIYENGLEEMVLRNMKAKRLKFTTSLESCLDDVEVVFSAVGTPPDEDGSADLKYVLEVARTIGRNMKQYKLVVTKSTVPVGTASKVRAVIQEELDKRGVKVDFDVASNPEFLKEGNAISDFMSPDRVVVGVESARAEKLMSKLYKPFLLNNFRVIFMDIPSAEMTKYAANSMLATRISFMNDIANLCEIVGADVNMVRQGIGSDSRIGNKFLYPGCGYGGSCFPKDVKALIRTALEYHYPMKVLEAVEAVNERQKEILFKKLYQLYDGEIKGAHKPIIERELYDKVQEMLSISGYEKIKKHQFLYSQLLTLQETGKLMTGEIKKGQYIYYKAYDNEKKYHCINETHVTEAILEYFKEIRLNLIPKEIVKSVLKEELKDLKQEYSTLKRNVSRKYHRKLRLNDFIKQGKIDDTDFILDELEDIENTYENLHERIKNSEEQIKKITSKCEDVMKKRLYDIYIQLNFGNQRKILELVKNKLELQDKRVKLTFKSAFRKIRQR